MFAPADGPSRLRHRRPPIRSGSVVLVLLVLVIVAAGIGGIVWFYFQRTSAETVENIIVRPVIRGPYEHIVLEQGQVESASSVEIRCEVKSRSPGGTEILWLVEEGTHVKKGDKLALLDSSALEQELVQQQIACNTSHALVVQAENTLRAAEIAKLEYLEGTYKQEEQAILSEIFVAEENLRRAQLAFQSTERLAAKGIVTALQLEGDQFAVEKAKNELEAAKTKLEVLRKYTKPKMLKTFESDIATAKARWEAEKKSYQLELEKLEDIKQQIEKCTIRAPEDGQVVYANVTNRFGGGEFVVEEGASVRERQVIFRLPDPKKMQIKATINESRVSLVKPGMPVAIEFDALRGHTIRGKVVKVNQYAEPASWRTGNIRQYATYIDIFDPPPEVRSGMSAEVRIYVEQLEDALQVPVQALYETKGHFFCLVKKGDGWETREVEVGSSNDTFMTIQSGLKEGELVAMNPRAYPEKLDLPDLPDDEDAVGEATEPAPAEARGPQAGKRRHGPPGAGPAPGSARPKGKPGRAGSGGFNPARIFSALDTDGDGVLSSEELQAVPAERRSRLAAADADGDGQVTREEFTAAMARFRASGKKHAKPQGRGE